MKPKTHSVLISSIFLLFFCVGCSETTSVGRTDQAISGKAAYLSLVGPASNTVNECSSNYTVMAKNKDGKDPLPFPANTNVRVSDLGNSSIFLDRTCTQQATGGSVPINLNTNSAVFYVSGNSVGTDTLTASLTGLVPASLSINYNPGTPSALRLNGPNVISAFSCEPVSLETIDATGALTIPVSPLTVQLRGSSAIVEIHDQASCNSPVANIQMTASPKHLWVLVNGTGTGLSVTASSVGFANAILAFSSLAGNSPSISVTGPVGNVVAGECKEFSVTLRATNGIPFPVRRDTLVEVSTLSRTAQLYNLAGCVGLGANSQSFSVPAGQSQASFFAKDELVESLIIRASAQDIRSGEISVSLVAAAAHHLSFSAAPPPAIRASDCSSAVRVTVFDQFGNGLQNSPINVALTGSGTAASSTQFFLAPGCVGTPISSLTLEILNGQSFKDFYFKSSRPGALMITGSSDGSVSANSSVISIDNSLAIPVALTLIAPAEAPVNRCIQLKAVSVDLSGDPVIVNVPFGINVKAEISGDYSGRVFSDATCTAQLADGSVALFIQGENTTATPPTSGGTEAIFYFKNTKAESAVVRISEIVSDTNPILASTDSIGSTKSIETKPLSPTKLTLKDVPQRGFVNKCLGPFSTVSVDEFNNVSAVSSTLSVNLASSKAAKTLFFSDELCTSAVTRVVIEPGTFHSHLAYVKLSEVGTLALFALPAGPGISSGSATMDDVVDADPASLALIGSSEPLKAGECRLITLSSKDANAAPSLKEAVAVDLSSTSDHGVFFATDACSANAVLASPIILSPSRAEVRFWVKATSGLGAFKLFANALLANLSDEKSLTVVPSDNVKLELSASDVLREFDVATWVGPYKINLKDEFENPVTVLSDSPFTFTGVGDVRMSATAGVQTAPLLLAGQSTADFFVLANVRGAVTLKVKLSTTFTTGAITEIDSSSLEGIQVLGPAVNLAQVDNPRPGFGNTAGGELIQIVATENFQAKTSIQLGGVPCEIIPATADPKILSCRTPASILEGPVPVTLRSPFSRDANIPNGFRYDAPVVANPPADQTTGGTQPLIQLRRRTLSKYAKPVKRLFK